jgi:hypothetical protein
VSSREHHLCTVRLDGRSIHFLWFTNDRDGIEEASPGKIRVFPDASSARKWGSQAGLVIAQDKPVEYDLDRVARWCEHPAKEGIDCNTFLDVWNLFGDLGSDSSTVFRAANRRGKVLYDKLFFGSNLPTFTPPGERYAPDWSELEVRELARVLRLGLAEFRDRVSMAAA